MREPNEALKRARRALDGFPGVLAVGEWGWHEGHQRWALDLRLSHGLAPTAHVPGETAWRLLVRGDFPIGDVQFFPALEDGIEVTFQHQRFNAPDYRQQLRTGHICLTRPEQSLGRSVDQGEPTDAADRMRWLVERAISWIRDAATGQLVRQGDPFELPDFQGAQTAEETVAFQEGADANVFWDACPERFGVATVAASERLFLVREFHDAKGGSIRRDAWGGIGDCLNQVTSAVWIRVDRMPVSEPWRPPETLGELRSVLNGLGVDLDGVLLPIADRHYKVFRNGAEPLLLLGFPMPIKFGMKPNRMHWQAFRLPPLSSEENSKGFRQKSLAARDRIAVLRDDVVLRWKRSENWAEENLSTRGRLLDGFRSKSIVVLGVGALGSALADLLVRGGAKDVVLVDADKFRAGNAVRHTLDLTSVGAKKVRAVAARISLVSPHAQISAVDSKLPDVSGAALEKISAADLVIDATGDDNLLKSLEGFAWKGAPDFASASFGYAARRLFCYFTPMKQFTYEGYGLALDPWLRAERRTAGSEDLPREGVGCWNPVFPARADDVWLLASVFVKWLEGTLHSRTLGLKVFEQGPDATGSFGVREIMAPPV